VADQGHQVRLWSRRAEHASAIEAAKENLTYLPGFTLPDNLMASSSIEEVVRDAEFVISVVPTHGTREVITRSLPFLPSDIPIIAATKGIENETLLLVSDIFRDVLPKDQHRCLAFLGGPSFAKEVAAGVPTAVCVGSHDPQIGEAAQNLLSTDRFRVYTTEDVIGVELGGALKNVVAIAAGIADGLGCGHNTRAALITRGLAEIGRLASTLGANPMTLAGLSGMGDLVLTCTGDLSRNRRVGLEIGRGKKLQEVLDGMQMVAEGVRTTKSAYQLAKREGVDMPIAEQVYAMLYEDKPPVQAVANLMTRPPRAERE
jgi:glycerol-3-phosphate dehydrogenase (NAD(P)+)